MNKVRPMSRNSQVLDEYDFKHSFGRSIDGVLIQQPVINELKEIEKAQPERKKDLIINTAEILEGNYDDHTKISATLRRLIVGI